MGTAGASAQHTAGPRRHAAVARTATPAFAKRAYQLQPRHYIGVRVATHGVWHASRTCTLAVSGPKYHTHRFSYNGVQADIVFTFTAPRAVTGGAWRLGFACQAPRQRPSLLAHTVIHVHRQQGRVPLIGPGGPVADPLQPTTGALGFGGVGVPPNPFENGQCTYWAYQTRSDIYIQSVLGGAPQGGWDAYKWAQFAAQYGHFAEGQTPVVGALMVEPPSASSSVGHVAYVSRVIDPGDFVTTEMHTYGGTPIANKVYTVYNDFGSPAGSYYYDAGGQLHRHVVAGTVFIYGGPAVVPTQYAGYLGHIVQWSGDTKAQKTAWLVVDEGGQLHRHWIPDIATYSCLKNAGAPGPDVLPSAALNAMPDDMGVWPPARATTVRREAETAEVEGPAVDQTPTPKPRATTAGTLSPTPRMHPALDRASDLSSRSRFRARSTPRRYEASTPTATGTSSPPHRGTTPTTPQQTRS